MAIDMAVDHGRLILISIQKWCFHLIMLYLTTWAVSVLEGRGCAPNTLKKHPIAIPLNWGCIHASSAESS